MCPTGLGVHESKLRVVVIPAKYGGKACPRNEQYLSAVQELITITSSDLTEADAVSLKNDPARQKVYVDALRTHIQAGRSGIIESLEMVKINFFDFGPANGGSGIDFQYQLRGKFELARHCEEFCMNVNLALTLPNANPADFESADAKQLCGDFVANHLGKLPDEITLVGSDNGDSTSDSEGSRSDRTHRRLTSQRGVTLNFKTCLTGTKMTSCAETSSQAAIQAKMARFLVQWKLHKPNHPPPAQLARMEAVLGDLNLALPTVKMEKSMIHELQKTESFEMKCPINCEQTRWRDSTCSEECGGGLITSTRKTTREAAHGGEGCTPLKKTTPCNVQVCPPKCEAYEWNAWGACSLRCGSGTQCRDAFNVDAFQARRDQCPVKQCRACNTEICGPDTCADKPTIPSKCSVRSYCCGTNGHCHISAFSRLCAGGTQGRFCQPEWYRFCTALADSETSKPCVFEALSADAYQDAQCEPVKTDCQRGDLILPPTETTDAKCVSPTVCKAHHYESTPVILPLADRKCKNLTVTCEDTTKAIDLSSDKCGGNAPFCDDVNKFIAAAPTATTDVLCDDLSVCSTSECENGEFDHEVASDRVCLQLGLDYISEEVYRANEPAILAKIAAAAQSLPGVVGAIPNIVTKTSALHRLAARRRIPKDAYSSDGHRLVLDLAVKAPNANFETIVLAKKNPVAPLVAGFQSDHFHKALCSSMKHGILALSSFTCEHLHVYSVDCKPLRSPCAVTLVGDQTMFIESSRKTYIDQGATGHDNVDGQIRIRSKGADKVNLAILGNYKVKYTCTNSVGMKTIKERIVIVHHADCPACQLVAESSETIEASFPFVDHAKLECADFMNVTKRVSGRVNVERAGTYVVTYSATDESGNTNECKGNYPKLTRRITVVDTLKPVIGLHWGNKQWFPSQEGEVSPITGRKNPIYDTAPALHAVALARAAARRSRGRSLMEMAAPISQNWGALFAGAAAGIAFLVTATRPRKTVEV